MFPHISCDTIGARAAFKVAAGSVHVAILGTTGGAGATAANGDSRTGPDHGEYEVTVDPPPPGGPPPVQSFSAFKPYIGLNSTLYMARLDPKFQYTVSVSVKGAGPIGSKINLSRVLWLPWVVVCGARTHGAGRGILPTGAQPAAEV